MSNPYALALPASPDLAQQRKRAKELLKAIRAGDEEAIKRLRYGHPRLADATDAELWAAKLHDAQWVIAREYGFSSWIKLKRHIDELSGANRRPYRLLTRPVREASEPDFADRTMFVKRGTKIPRPFVRSFSPSSRYLQGQLGNLKGLDYDEECSPRSIVNHCTIVLLIRCSRPASGLANHRIG